MVCGCRPYRENEPHRRATRVRDHLTIRGKEQLHAIGDPTRWRILGRLLVGPASIQELAQALGAAKGTIGHHVRVLEGAGLIRVAETKRVRGVTEKRYLRVARQFRLPETEEDGASAETAYLPVRAALAEARPTLGKADPSMSLVVRARMPAARAKRFADLINQIADRVRRRRTGDRGDVRLRRRDLHARLGR